MRGISHIQLGKYLAGYYLNYASTRQIQAFLFGCLEPDRNPFTYLKGSIQHRWLRGHNYANTRHFLRRISDKLEKKKYWTLFDYYSLGKLIHYTADAFTQAHNETFPKNISMHLEYEEKLQNYFLTFIENQPLSTCKSVLNLQDLIFFYHKQYEHHTTSVYIDSLFVTTVCCCIMSKLFTNSV